MTKVIIKILVLFCLFTCIPGYTLCTDSDEQVKFTKEALIRWLCWDKYWGWGPYEQGITVPIEIKIDKESFYVWINDLLTKPDFHVAGFYTGRIKDGQGAVMSCEGYSIPYNIKPDKKRYFETGQVIKDNITIPKDCSPCYDPPSPQKELMFRMLVKTMKNELSQLARMGLSESPKKIFLTIANFNIDYPSTYVLAEPLGAIYRVVFHSTMNVQEYDDNFFEKLGGYPIGEMYDPSHDLIAKIRKHGITREIILDGHDREFTDR
ncbi:MAG: hypothetical protein NT010_06810 [Proteobacteria bacterium]|nr:hypothetical protein [Pseudomonadota bacterium]